MYIAMFASLATDNKTDPTFQQVATADKRKRQVAQAMRILNRSSQRAKDG